MFDFLKKIYDYSKSFFSKKGGLAALQAYAPFGLKPTPEEQKVIQTIPQVSVPPLEPGKGIEAIQMPSATSPTPTYQYIPPKTEVPTAGGALLGQNIPPQVPVAPTITQEQASKATEIPTTPVTAPLPTIPAAPTGFATGEPTIVLQGIQPTSETTPSGLSSIASAPAIAPASLAPSGGYSGPFAGFSPATVANFAQSMGIPSSRINPQTGEIINPTEEEIKEFNKRYKTTPVSGIVSPTPAPSIKTAGITPPTLPPPTSGATNEAYFTSLSVDLEAKRKSVEAAYNKQLADLQTKVDQSNKQIEAITAQQQGAVTNIETLSKPFREALENAERDRLYITKNFEENQKLTDELASLLTEGTTLIAQQKATPGVPTAIMNRKVAGLMSDITARAGVIEATLAARNNQIAQAYTLIDRSINAINADRTDQINYYKTLYNFYQNQKDEEGKKLITLTSNQKTYLNAQIRLLENDFAVSLTNAENLKKAMTDPDTALAYASAGVTLNDTPQQINAKLAQYAYSKEVSDQNNTMAEKGYSYLGPGQSSPAGTEVVTTTDTQGRTKYWYKKPSEPGIRTSTTPQREDVATMNQALSSQTGADGYVSAESWNYAKQNWMSEGLMAEDFDKNFSNFVNPNYSTEYR